MQLVLLSLILVLAIGLFVTQAVRIEITSLLIIFLLVVAGILNPDEALSGFSNEATITVGAMFVLSAGLVRTGVLDYVSAVLARLAGTSRIRLLLVLGLIVGIFSAFVNNTPVVVMMIPVTLTLCRRFRLPPSKMLIPLSYFSILGGTCTLIGTSTNILVHSLHRDAGGSGFGLFEFTAMGLCQLLIGGTYVLLASGRLLPERMSLSHMLDRRDRSSFVTELTVPEGSPLIGQSMGEFSSGSPGVRVLELIRDEQVSFAPAAAMLIEAGDTLLIEAGAQDIHTLTSGSNVQYASVVEDNERVSISRLDVITAEAVILPNSTYLDRQLREIGLNRTYGIKVLAVRRLGRHHQYQLRNMTLRVGDVLLIQGDARALHALQESGNALLIEGVGEHWTFPQRAPMALAIMAAVVLLASFDVLPISLLALGGAAAMLLCRCLPVAEATRSLESSVLLLLAGTIPLGLAMQKTGMATGIAHWVLGYTGQFGPIVLVSSFYLLTSLFTECLSNNATAVLLTPIALGVAAEAGIDPKPLLVAVAFGASASFATPIGYQTNTMVMGPGGYLFRDYLKVGTPLNLVLWASASVLIPVFFSF
jgi:di/tricarboxylate transporter